MNAKLYDFCLTFCISVLVLMSLVLLGLFLASAQGTYSDNVLTAILFILLLCLCALITLPASIYGLIYAIKKIEKGRKKFLHVTLFIIALIFATLPVLIFMR